ncbi:MAG TPA: hypothetical protein VGE90_08925, partial [Chitinophaga sp.]
GARDTLTGALDEMSEEHFFIKSRIGYWKKEMVGNVDLYKTLSSGTMAGEGAVFFSLSSTKTDHTYARISGLKMLYKPTAAAVAAGLSTFLQEQQLSPEDISLVIIGRNGDSNFEHFYKELDAVMGSRPQLPFKHLCGEYETAGAVAVWLAAHIMKAQQIPQQWFPMEEGFPLEGFNRILIYNHFFGEQHAFILLERE